MSTAVATLAVLPLGVCLMDAKLTDASSNLLKVVIGYFTFFLALATSITAYRLSPFHPLARYPGPIPLRITKWFAAYISARGDYHMYVKRLHETYGPIVRVGPNELSIVDKGVIAPVLGTQGMPRGPLWDGRRFRQAGNTKPYDSLIDVRDSHIHRSLRKDWNTAFNSAAVKDYQELVENRLKQFRDLLYDAVSVSAAKKGAGNRDPIDLGRWVTHFSTDVMGDLAFGGVFNLMRDGDADGFRHTLDEGLVLPSIIQHVPWINPFLLAIPFISAKMKVFAGYGVTFSKKRMSTPTKQKDLYYYLYEIPGEKTERTEAEQFDLIVSNSLLTMVAGSDTTATTLSAVMCYLLSDRRAYKTLREELDDAFPDSSAGGIDGWPELDGDVLTRLPYLNAVLNEGLRLVPAVPSMIQRNPEPGSGGKVLGDTQIFIPEGIAVDIPVFALQRDTRYFSPCPDDFIPERWLPDAHPPGQKGGKFTTDREAYIPFSYGPANCAGKALAINELKYVIAMLVRCFDVHHFGCESEPEDSSALKARAEDWTRGLKDRFVFEKPGLLVSLTPRKVTA